LIYRSYYYIPFQESRKPAKDSGKQLDAAKRSKEEEKGGIAIADDLEGRDKTVNPRMKKKKRPLKRAVKR
jgi:hypothetical protein